METRIAQSIYHYDLIAWAFLLGTTLGVSIRVLRIFTVLMKYAAPHATEHRLPRRR